MEKRQPRRHHLPFVPAEKPRSVPIAEIHAAIDRLAHALSSRLESGPAPLFLSIANGGNILTQRLARHLSTPTRPITTGILDTTFHRDDIAHRPIPDEITPSHIPIDVHGAHILLIDDVLHTGRTIKAALDEIFEYGRPASVQLAILIDRGGRRLPFAPDFIGLTLPVPTEKKIHLRLHPTDPALDSLILP